MSTPYETELRGVILVLQKLDREMHANREGSRHVLVRRALAALEEATDSKGANPIGDDSDLS